MTASQLGGGRAWRPRAVALAASALFFALAGGPAFAQTNTTGSVYGTVAPGPNVQVLVEGASGIKRTLTPDANGRIQATSLPTGTYKATLLRDGKVVGTTSEFEVKIGQGTEVVFGGTSTQTVEVTGRVLKLDMSSVSNGTTFSASTLASVPMAATVDSIIRLSANTAPADPRYAGGASIGGGAPSENSYYINGFPVTNPLTQLGASQLPFFAIRDAQVLTGGFGAEFGRSIGGVVNITTKSGTNSWEGGVAASFTPSSLRAKYKDLNYANTGTPENASTDGTLYRRFSDRKKSEWSLGGYVSGPLVQDKLFMFVGVERIKNHDELMSQPVTGFSGTYSPGGWADRKNTNDRYIGKFDWNITSDHSLELTLIGDNYKRDQSLYGYDYATGVHDNVLAIQGTFENDATNANTPSDGAQSQILRYNGLLTKDLTLSVLLGQSTTKHKSSYAGVDVYSNVRQVSAPATNRYPGLTYGIPYPFPAATTVPGPGAEDTVKAGRIDLEYSLGTHLLRAGLDTVKLSSKDAGDYTAGGGTYSYFRTTNPNLKPNGATTSVSAGGALFDGTYYYYGREQIFSTVTNADSNQSAFYLEDKWQATPNLFVTPGLRVEKYENVNGDGETFLKVKTMVHPRFAFGWDVLGDKTTKVFGSAGRYGVQIPTHLAVRGASRSTFTRQPFTYQGVDPVTGAPTGRVNIGDPFSTNNEYGQAKDANTVAAQDMKPNSQDELTLGIERALTEKFNVGASLTYRKLVATVDDLCDPRPFEKYAVDHGIDTTNWGGFGCASFNPGQDNTFLVDYSGQKQYTTVHLSKEDLGFDKAKRTYMALNFFAEHPFSDGWFGRVMYTYAKSRGNTEGQTLSDVAQTDVAATQTWDHPELMQYAYGNLPGDRRHQIKAFGFVRVTPQWDVGAAFTASSGRPKNCLGNYGGTPLEYPGATTTFDDINYGSSYHYCSFNGGASSDPSPRGSQGYLPWDYKLDMNLVFAPEWAKGLKLRADVFNVLNKQTLEAISETHEVDYDPSTVLPTYARPISYTEPRYVKFSVQYDVKF